MDTIKICMGSSCFGRGNAAIVDVLTRFIADHKLADRIEVSGSLCMSAENSGSTGTICAQGPNIRINEKLISGVTADTLGDIITRELGLTV